MKKLIGITMRVISSMDNERRDAIAQDWGRFMHTVGVDWVPLPNIGPDAAGLAARIGVSGLLFSGGDSIGVTPERDETETSLLLWALAENVPVLGVCRGMQVLQHSFGGELCPVDRRRHVGGRHPIRFENGEQREVNSWHTTGLLPGMLAASLSAVACCPMDGTVEAVMGRDAPLYGVLWHPEREAVANPADVRLCRELWGLV